MPYTEFNPMGSPGDPGRTYMQAGAAQMSLMERAQAMERRRQVIEMEKAKWNVEAPVMAAEMESKMYEYGASLKERRRTASLYAEFANNSDQMQADFEDAMSTALGEDGKPDWESNFRNIQNVRAKWNKYAMLPQAQGWFRNVDLEAKFAFDRANIEYKANSDLNEAKLRASANLPQTILNGVKYEVDPRTGEMVEYKGAYPSPQQAAAKVGAEEEARQKAKRDVEYLTKIEEAGDSASQDLVSVKSMSSMLKSKGASTGYGQSSINTFVSVLDRAGIPVDSEKLSNNQYIEQQMSLLKVRLAGSLMRGQGQITEKERDMLERATASVNWTPETNIRILDSMAKMFERAKQLNRIKLAMEQDGKSSAEIRMAIEQYKQENDFSFDLEEAQNRAGDGASGPKQITSKADFDALPSGAQFIFNGKVGTKK